MKSKECCAMPKGEYEKLCVYCRENGYNANARSSWVCDSNGKPIEVFFHDFKKCGKRTMSSMMASSLQGFEDVMWEIHVNVVLETWKPQASEYLVNVDMLIFRQNKFNFDDNVTMQKLITTYDEFVDFVSKFSELDSFYDRIHG